MHREISKEELARRNRQLRDSYDAVYAPGGSGRMAGGAEEERFDSGNKESEESTQAIDDERVDTKEDDEGIPLQVKVYAWGCSPESDYFLTDVTPSTITISGMVRDQYNDPVVNATVVLVEKGVEVLTDPNGRYVLQASHNGDTPYGVTVNFGLVRQMTGLRGALTPVDPIVANGKTAEVTLELWHDRGPLANQAIDISDSHGFTRDARQVEYVWSFNSNSAKHSTDSRGRVSFLLSLPESVTVFPAGLTDATAFPVTGHLRVRVPESETETLISYIVDSPFPRILDCNVPHYIEAGLWQAEPSEVVVQDLDSKTFDIALSGPGSFKRKGDARVKGWGSEKALHAFFEGKSFAFHYKPILQGFDIHDEPKVVQKIAKWTANVSLSVTANVAGEELLKASKVSIKDVQESKLVHGADGAQFVIPQGVKTVKTYVPVSDGAKKMLSGASNTANALNAIWITQAGQDEVKGFLQGEFTDKNVMTTVDSVIGLTDTIMGLGDMLKGPKAKLYWEAIKASWEADKIAYDISKKYYELAEAYQEMVQEPVVITVVDDSGRKASATVYYNVLVWRGGS